MKDFSDIGDNHVRAYLTLTNIIDYFFTTKVLNLGAEEWNPIVEYLIDIELFVVIKILIIPVVLLLIWKLRSWCYCQRKLS